MRPLRLRVLLLFLASACSDRPIAPVGDDEGTADDSGDDEEATQESDTTPPEDLPAACERDPECMPYFTVCVSPGEDAPPMSCTEICDEYSRGRAVCIERGCDGMTAVGWEYHPVLHHGFCGEDWTTYHEVLEVGCDDLIDFKEPNSGLVACCCDW